MNSSKNSKCVKCANPSLGEFLERLRHLYPHPETHRPIPIREIARRAHISTKTYASLKKGATYRYIQPMRCSAFTWP